MKTDDMSKTTPPTTTAEPAPQGIAIPALAAALAVKGKEKPAAVHERLPIHDAA